MIEDLFGDFDFNDVEEKKVEQLKFIKPEDYMPFHQKEGWFFESNTEDEDSYKASYYYAKGQYEEAYKSFLKDLESRKHNRLHLITIYDSILRCSSKMTNPVPNIRYFIDQYDQLVQNYSDQLQFWDTVVTALRNINEEWAVEVYIKYMCMLCSTVDLPEYWLSFGKCPNIKEGPNYKIGYLTKAYILFEDQSLFTHGPAKAIFQKKMLRISEELNRDFPEDKIIAAKKEMDYSMSRRSKDNTDDLSLPVYKCRSEQTALRTKEDIETISNNFRNQYQWMFEKM